MALARLAVSSSVLFAAVRRSASAARPASHNSFDARSRTANRGLASSSIACLISSADGAGAATVVPARTRTAAQSERATAGLHDRDGVGAWYPGRRGGDKAKGRHETRDTR